MALSRRAVVRQLGNFVCLVCLFLFDNKVRPIIAETKRDRLQGRLYFTSPSSVRGRRTSDVVEASGDGESGAFKRNLLQKSEQLLSRGKASLVDPKKPLTSRLCTLSKANVTKLYNESSRIWVIGNESLAALNDDVQSVIDCANQNDTLLFNANRIIKPKTTLSLSKNLILSSHQGANFGRDASQISTSKMVRFTCPDSGDLISAKSPSFTLRDFAIEGYNSKSNFIELNPNCVGGRFRGTVRFLRLIIDNNKLSNEARIINSKSSCFHLEPEDIRINQNRCSSESCVLLSSSNTLKNIQLLKNKGSRNSFPESSIFSATKGSETTAENITSEENQIRSFYVLYGTLNITESYFNNNIIVHSHRTSDDAIGGGVLFSNHSKVIISFTNFERNSAFDGGGVYATSSNVTISDCNFGENDAGEGKEAPSMVITIVLFISLGHHFQKIECIVALEFFLTTLLKLLLWTR